MKSFFPVGRSAPQVHRSDTIETPQVIKDRLKPAQEFFSPDRLLLTSECGFGHVPLDITRAKIKVLVETCQDLRKSL